MDCQKDLKQAALPNNEIYAYRERGTSDKVVVLIHSNLTSSYYFETLFPYLVKTHRIIAPDLRGYGHSTCSTAPKALDDFVSDLKLFVDCLELKEFILIGWALGSGVSMKFAAQYPKSVTKLILLNCLDFQGPPSYLEDENGDQTEVRAKSMEDILKIPKNVKLDKALIDQDKDQIEAILLKTYFDGKKKPSKDQLSAFASETLRQKSYSLASYMMNAFNISTQNNKVVDGTGEMKKITCNLMIVGGVRDRFCPPDNQLDIGRAFGDKAQVKVFENCGHFAFWDNLEEIGNIIRLFAQMG